MDLDLFYVLEDYPDLQGKISPVLQKAWNEGVFVEVKDSILTQDEYNLSNGGKIKKEKLYADINYWCQLGVYFSTKFEPKFNRIGTTNYYEYRGNKYYFDDGMMIFYFLISILRSGQDIPTLYINTAFIYSFQLFIYSLPQNMRLLFSREIFRLLPTVGIKEMKNDESYAMFLIEIFKLLFDEADNKKDFLAEFHKYTDIFSTEDHELMIEKWNNLSAVGNTSIFFDWLVEEFDSQIEEYIELEFQNSYRKCEEYIISQFKKNGIDLSVVMQVSPPSLFQELEIFFALFGFNYEEWKVKFKENNCLPPLPRTENLAYDFSKDSYYYSIFIYTEIYFECFFRMMNSDKITENDCLYVYSKLEERGLSYYIQQIYDEYRKVTGKGRDLQFYKRIDVDEIHKALEKYYTRLKDGRVDQSFYRYLPRIIDEVIPNLKTGAEVNAFIRILWRDNLHFDKYRKKSEDNRYYPAFRDELVNIFHLNHIPSINTYSVEKVPVPDRSRDLWHRYEVFQQMIEQKQL